MRKVIKQQNEVKISNSPAGTTRAKSRKCKQDEEEEEAESQDPTASTQLGQEKADSVDRREEEEDTPVLPTGNVSLEFSEESDFITSQSGQAKKKRRKSENVATSVTPQEKRKQRVVDKKIEEGKIVKRF